ncbi:hypothetical protein QTP70_012253, partial [Hemibagrus guttatus]
MRAVRAVRDMRTGPIESGEIILVGGRKLLLLTTTQSTGAPQGCVLSPLLFTLLTHDCAAMHSSNHIDKFTDDTTVVGLISKNHESAYREEVQRLTAWYKAGIKNVEKTKEIVVDFRRAQSDHSPLNINESNVEIVKRTKFLGVHLAEDLTWSLNTSSITMKAQQRLYFLGTIESILSSCITAWFGNCTVSDRKTLQWTNNCVCVCSSPDKKVMLCNVPPFISDEAIGKELSRYGRMVSPIKKIPLGCKSPLTGHLARACPERQSDPGVSERPGQDAAEPAGVVPPAAAVRPAAEGPGAAAAPDLTESEPQAQPAAQTPTGATSAPEKPRTAEPATAEPRSARPDRKKPWSTEKSSVGSGAVLEP